MRRNQDQQKTFPKLQVLPEGRPGAQHGGGFLKSSLRTTIMCWFLVISLVPVIFVSLVGHRKAVQNRIHDISGRLQAVSLMEKLDLEKYFRDLQYQVASKAKSPFLGALVNNPHAGARPSALVEDAYRELLELRDNTKALNVLVTDVQTRVVLSCDPTVEVGTNWAAIHGAGSKLEKTFEWSLVQGKAAFSGYVKARIHGQISYAYHVEPILNTEGVVGGFILVKLGEDSFHNGLGRYELVGKGVQFYALNEELDLLTDAFRLKGNQSHLNSVLTEIAVGWKNNRDAARSLGQRFRAAEVTGFSVHHYVGLHGEKVMGVIQDLEIMGAHVGLVSEISQEVVLAGLKRMDYSLLGLILVVGLLVALAGMVVSSLLVAPINQLGQVMQRVSDGHEVWALPERGPQEVRRLTDMFHFMISKLTTAQEVNERQFALQRAQFDLNEKLRGKNSLEDMAQAGLEYFVSHYSAQMGVFYLLESKNLLRVAAKHGVRDASDPIPEIRLGHGVVGQVAEHKRIQVLHGINEDRHRFETGLVKSSVTNLILVPIHLEGRILGVLELGVLADVQEEDLDLLRLVGENVAVAINAVRSRERVNRLLKETWSQTTALSKQQKELRDSNRQLELADQYKSEFLANMSHELRTPLNSLLIMSQVLAENREQNLSRSEVDAAMTINKAGSDLLLLIDDILDLSRVEAGKLDLCFEGVELKSLVTDMQDLFSPLAEKQGVEFRAVQGPELPATMVSDPLRLTQILKNILNNAFKFTEQGSVTFRVRCTAPGEMAELDADSPSPWVVFSVADTGIGMNKNTLGRIFEAFNQGDGSIGRRYGGSGLGLSISRKLSDMLGGVIKVESVEGKGSTFRLFLPVKPSGKTQEGMIGEPRPDLSELALPLTEQKKSRQGPEFHEDELQEEKNSRAEKHETYNPIDLTGRKILICDDDMRMVFRISEIVDELGAEVTLAHSWPQGVEKCRGDADFDFAIVSHRLADRPGGADIATWKSAVGEPSFPVLTLVQDGDDQDSAGADLVGSRPLQREEFLDLVKTVLDPGWVLKTTLMHL